MSNAASCCYSLSITFFIDDFKHVRPRVCSPKLASRLYIAQRLRAMFDTAPRGIALVATEPEEDQHTTLEQLV